MKIKKLDRLDERIPRWNLENLEHRLCPVCSTDVDQFYIERPDGLFIKKCNICSTYFVSPSPSNSALDRFYENYHQSHFGGVDISASTLLKRLVKQDPYIDPRIQTLSSHIKISGSKVLDVGCGNGEFLYMLKKIGAQPYGIEFDPLAVGYAREIGIINVHRGSIDSFSSNVKFDFITMMDFIEHPLDPMMQLKISIELLSPGGLILIWTPNGDRPVDDDKYITFRIDLEHMQYFSSLSINYVSHILNLEILHLETVGHPFLNSIARCINRRSKIAPHIKNIFRNIPWFETVNSIRHAVASKNFRTGNYHLFCILRKAKS